MKIIIENADQRDFNELANLARHGKIHTFYMTDEEERPQGEWIIHITYFECSNCKHCYDYDYAEDIDPITDLIFNFCPDCGASMKKGGAE